MIKERRIGLKKYYYKYLVYIIFKKYLIIIYMEKDFRNFSIIDNEIRDNYF